LGLSFGWLDLVIFFTALFGAMAVGFIAGRKEETSEDYFLAGRKIPWWGVAGSIFGSNVSANHMVGMMGVGLSIGFAQSHFEIGAIAGLVLLCYGFLPVYRKLNLFTLSEYLEKRYDHRSRICYAVIMVIIMAVIQLVPGLYIGARSICVLAGDFALETQTIASDDDGSAEAKVVASPKDGAAEDQPPGPENSGPENSGQENTESNGTEAELKEKAAGAAPTSGKMVVKQKWYIGFVLILAFISGSYTILGGLKAVVWTDFIQSILLLIAGVVVACLVFHALGGGVLEGWQRMRELDSSRLPGESGAFNKMSLYLPMNHPGLPWTGVLTGLLAMHFYYWGTNQFIVQRALGAKSDHEAKIGIIAAGFLKLLIPFFAIAAGVAAFYLFREKLDRPVAQDTAFTEAVKLVVPAGFGLIGLIAAGLIGAILSSIDSMMNSAATLVTIDVYKRYFRPDADDKEMILVGRITIVVFVTVAALMAIFVLDPNSESSFFLMIANYQNYFTPGLLVAFGLGMLWRRGTPLAGLAAIVAGVVLSFGVEKAYDATTNVDPTVFAVMTEQTSLDSIEAEKMPAELKPLTATQREAFIAERKTEMEASLPIIGSRMTLAKNFGVKLNFFHRVIIVVVLCSFVYVIVSLCTPYDAEKGRLIWTDLGGHRPETIGVLAIALVASIGVYALLAFFMVTSGLPPSIAAVCGSLWTFAMFVGSIFWSKRKVSDDKAKPSKSTDAPLPFFADDRLWAGILCGLAVFMMFYFY